MVTRNIIVIVLLLMNMTYGVEDQSTNPEGEIYHRPLIIQKGSVYSIDPSLELLLPDLCAFIGYSYIVGKYEAHPDAKKSKSKHRRHFTPDIGNWREDRWHLSGCSGYVFDDYPGVIVYNKDQNLIVVSFPGSRWFADWITNASQMQTDPASYGLKFDGKFHFGFLSKYASLKESLESGIDHYYSGQ